MKKWQRNSAIGAGIAAVVVGGGLLAYPTIAKAKIQEKAVLKLTERFAEPAAIQSIENGYGWAELSGVTVGERPNVVLDKVRVEYSFLDSLVGKVSIEKVSVDGGRLQFVRSKEKDELRLFLDALRSGDGNGTGRGGGFPILAKKVVLNLDDQLEGIKVEVQDMSAEKRSSMNATISNVVIETKYGQVGKVPMLKVSKPAGASGFSVQFEGAEGTVLRNFGVSGVSGKVLPEPNGNYQVTMDGSYAGVEEKMWNAVGSFDLRGRSGRLKMNMERFKLVRLQSLLNRGIVLSPENTIVDTKLHLEYENDQLAWEGEVTVENLNLHHPMVAKEPIEELSGRAFLKGEWDRKQGVIVVNESVLEMGAIVVSVESSLNLPIEPEKKPVFHLKMTMPKTSCQAVLDSVPKGVLSGMKGVRVRGKHGMNIEVSIDWNDLKATKLDGDIALRRCFLVGKPLGKPGTLLEEFSHRVEVEKEKYKTVVVGPTNPDFVYYLDISPYLVASIITTEDSLFYRHRGFTREFESALIRNLEAGYFRWGASSITMQMVKNVLLSRKKTLLRKFRELVLTWYVEQFLSKERILEIYFNAIEYGPWLYGIGPAAKHYFGKHARDLSIKEAAFFSSILPNPKKRYLQYCNNQLSRWTQGKMDRILALLLKRGRITQDEYDLGVQEPFQFVYPDDFSPQACRKLAQDTLKNAPSTSPYAE